MSFTSKLERQLMFSTFQGEKERTDWWRTKCYQLSEIKNFHLQLTYSKYKEWIQPEPISPVRLSNRYCFYGYVHLEEFLSYHSPAAWWNSQSSCAGLPPRSSQTGGKGSWTSRHRAQRSKYLGRCHSPSPGSNLKTKGKTAKRWKNGKFSCDFHIFHY